MTTRRRVLSILAGAAALRAFGAKATPNLGRWRGIALGAEARIVLDHPQAEVLIPRAVAEIRRLESIFSLYLPDSQLSRLNRDGALKAPAFELVELLSLCAGIHARTNGAFDPTVQTLWSLYARQHSQGSRPTREQINRALADTGWRQVVFSPDGISLGRSGMSLTLNGIAQGFIADRVADLFRSYGIANVLVNTGEIVALGLAPDGAPWQVKLAGPEEENIPLRNGAIATSAPLGTAFDSAGTVGHIIDPRTGYPGGHWSQVSVISLSAAEADGLSTAFCLMDTQEIAARRGSSIVLLR